MPSYVRDAGVWKPHSFSVKDAGVWKSPSQAYVRDAGIWKPLLSTGFTYIGATSGVASDGGANRALLSFHGSVAAGDLAIAAVRTDDPGGGYPVTPSGWSSIALGTIAGCSYKFLSAGDISSPPYLLGSNDSNAWVCYILRGVSAISVGGLYSYSLSANTTKTTGSRSITSGSAGGPCAVMSFCSWKSNPTTGSIDLGGSETATVSALQGGSGTAQMLSAIRLLDTPVNLTRTSHYDTVTEFYIEPA